MISIIMILLGLYFITRYPTRKRKEENYNYYVINNPIQDYSTYNNWEGICECLVPIGIFLFMFGIILI